MAGRVSTEGGFTGRHLEREREREREIERDREMVLQRNTL